MANKTRQPIHGGKMVKAWGRWFEVPIKAHYITAEHYKGALRVCAFLSFPEYQEAISNLECYFWYPSDYKKDTISRLAWPSHITHYNLKPEASLRRILPTGKCVRC